MVRNSSLVADFSVSKLNAPLIYPFRTALGQHDELENVLFRIKLANGVEGFGEAGIAPHITGETVSETIKNLRRVGKKIIEQDVNSYQTISSDIKGQLLKNRAALAAVEMAMLDALTKTQGIPLWKFFGKHPKRLVSDITIVIASLMENEGAVRVFYRHGFRAFKVKIGRDSELDLHRVLAVKRLAPKSAIYLDANQGYSARQTIQFLKALKKKDVWPELIEQPVTKNDWDGLAEVTRAKLAPVCADESVYSVEDCRKLIALKAADVVNIKLMKSGLLEGREIALLAKKNGLKLMIGGMMETSLSMLAAAHFAAGLGCFDFIDLDPPFFIREGMKNNPYLSPAGVYDLRDVKSGIGITLAC